MGRKKKPVVPKLPKRATKYEGFDFYEDQLEEVKVQSIEKSVSRVSIIRDALDKHLGLPKDNQNETTF